MSYDYVELRLPEDREVLIAWLSAEPWPFHVRTTATAAGIARRIDDGGYDGPDSRCFWMIAEGGERVGFIHLFELEDVEDGSPLFDLRIKRQWRGKGLGSKALSWLTTYLFETYPTLNRVEGNTRVDNLAMRRTFLTCGYAKEGHFREGWPAEDGRLLDSVHYGMLRRDWAAGTTSPVSWEA